MKVFMEEAVINAIGVVIAAILGAVIKGAFECIGRRRRVDAVRNDDELERIDADDEAMPDTEKNYDRYYCEFPAVTRNLGDKSAENYANILDFNGNVIKERGLIYYKPSSTTGTNMIYLKYPYSLIPYDSHCIKVAFFESESDRGGKPVDVVESLYDYDWSHYDDKKALDVCFPCKIKTLSSEKTYEAHFYKDEVMPENFVSKVVGLKFA